MDGTMTVLDQDVCTEVSVSEIDRMELASFIRMVVSDPELRALFATDASAAIVASGVNLSPVAAQALTRSASLALGLTDEMDDVLSSFFFFLIA